LVRLEAGPETPDVLDADTAAGLACNLQRPDCRFACLLNPPEPKVGLRCVGQQRFSSPADAVASARENLRHGGAAARETSRWLDDARQATATVGLVFDDQADDEIEEPY